MDWRNIVYAMVGNKAKQGWDLFKQPKVPCCVNGLSSYQMWLSCNSDIPDANMTLSASCLAVIDLCLCRIGDLSYLSFYTFLCTYWWIWYTTLTPTFSQLNLLTQGISCFCLCFPVMYIFVSQLSSCLATVHISMLLSWLHWILMFNQTIWKWFQTLLNSVCIWKEKSLYFRI